MLLRYLFVLLFCLAVSGQARACKVEAQLFDAQAAAAPQVFVGTVRTVEVGLAMLYVEKAVKGIGEGETVNFDTRDNDCAIRFQPGQRWLYLGGLQSSGSLLMMDEYGRPNAAGIAAATKLLGAAPPESPDLRRGRLDYSCNADGALTATTAAPLGSSAIGITLDNGISAGVYLPVDALENKTPDSVLSYAADGKKEQGHAVILQCKTGKPAPGEQPCSPLQGTVKIAEAGAEEVSGNVQVTEGEHHSLYVFRVTRTPKPPACQ